MSSLSPAFRTATGQYHHAAHRLLVLTVVVFWSLVSIATGTPFDRKPSDIYADNVRSIVQFEILRADGKRLTASGFVVKAGVVATNAHVVRNLRHGRVYYGTPPSVAVIESVLASWPEVDLALVSVPGINAGSAPSLKLAASKDMAGLRIGDPVYIIGNPGGLTNSLAIGFLSARRRLDGAETLQVTASIAQGSSGSPVLTSQGKVVGVIRSTAIKGTDIVLATPISYLADLMTGRHANTRTTARTSSRTGAALGLVQRPTERRRSRPDTREDNGQIVFGVPHAVSSGATAHVLKAIIESRFPHRATLRRGANSEILKGIADNHGTFDVHVEVWLPNHCHLWETYVLNRQNVGFSPGYRGFQGLCTNGSVLVRHGIKHVRDLLQPRVAALFDSDGDGKGEVWIGDPSWSVADINTVKMRDYGLNRYYSPFADSEDAHLKRLERKLTHNEPVLFHCYLPHWLGEKYDIVAVEEPPHNPDCFNVHSPALNEKWYEESVAKCRGPKTEVRIVYSKRLENIAPGVAAFLATIDLSASDVSSWASAFKRGVRAPNVIAASLADRVKNKK